MEESSRMETIRQREGNPLIFYDLNVQDSPFFPYLSLSSHSDFESVFLEGECEYLK